MIKLLVLLFSFNLYAQVPLTLNKSNRSREIKNFNYSNKCLDYSKAENRKQPLSSNCFEKIITDDMAGNFDYTKNMTVIGNKNIIGIRTKTRTNFITGTMSKLTEIQGIKLTQNEKYVLVLNMNNGVQNLFIFDATMSGNIAPIVSLDIHNIIDVTYSVNSNTLFLLNRLYIDSFSFKNNKLKYIRKLNIESNITPSQIINTNSELIIYDSIQDVLYGTSLELPNSTISWDWSHPFQESNSTIEKIIFDSQSQSLFLFNNMKDIFELEYGR